MTVMAPSDVERGYTYARKSAYLKSYVWLKILDGDVVELRFLSEATEEAHTDHPLMDQLFDYLDGDRVTFSSVSVRYSDEMQPIEREILDAVRSIPYGTQRTVGELATEIPGLSSTDERDLLTIQRALAVNPVPIIIPDHRVRDGPSAAPPRCELLLRALERL